MALNWAKSFDISKYLDTLTVCSSNCLLPGNLCTQIQTTENIVFWTFQAGRRKSACTLVPKKSLYYSQKNYFSHYQCDIKKKTKMTS